MASDDRLIYQVFLAQQRLRTYLKKGMAAKGINVTAAQAGILFLLRHKDGQSMTELSQALSIDNSTITGLIDRMESSGLVTRSPGPADRRMFLIFITEKGIEESEKAKTMIKEVNEKIKEDFSTEEIETFKRVLSSFSVKFGNK